jgi:hypothetical protein
MSSSKIRKVDFGGDAAPENENKPDEEPQVGQTTDEQAPGEVVESKENQQEEEKKSEQEEKISQQEEEKRSQHEEEKRSQHEEEKRSQHEETKTEEQVEELKADQQLPTEEVQDAEDAEEEAQKEDEESAEQAKKFEQLKKVFETQTVDDDDRLTQTEQVADAEILQPEAAPDTQSIQPEDFMNMNLTLLRTLSSDYFLNKHSPSFKCLEQYLCSRSDLRLTLNFFPPLPDPGLDEALNFIRKDMKS